MSQITDEIVKLVTILHSNKVDEEEKVFAEKRLKQIRYEVTKKEYNVPDDRVYDVMELEDTINSPATPEFHKEKARQAIKKILSETPIIKSMRKSLIKAHQDKNIEEVKDIQDYVFKHKHLQ